MEPLPTPSVPGPAPAPARTLRIEPGGWQIPLAPGQSLLQAALAAGVQLPSSCRNGACRTCMCRLLSGRVRYRIDWPGLLAEEHRDGWILPCVAEPAGDDGLVIESPHAVSLFDAPAPAGTGAAPAGSNPGGTTSGRPEDCR